MKNYFFYVLICFSFFSFSQNLEVLYQAEFIAVPSDDNLKELSVKDLKMAQTISQKLANTVNNQKLSLIANSNSFVLKVEEQMKIDTEVISPIIGRSALQLYSYVYSDRDDHTLGYDLDRENIIEFTNNSVSWEITVVTKQILGFKCFKALPHYQDFPEDQQRGLPTAAWFTPEINIKGGPLVYNDLPGLILEVESELTRITAIKISETDAQIKFPKTDKKIISKKEHDELIKQKYQAIRGRM
jgi:GLPGLI family protein